MGLIVVSSSVEFNYTELGPNRCALHEAKGEDALRWDTIKKGAAVLSKNRGAVMQLTNVGCEAASLVLQNCF